MRLVTSMHMQIKDKPAAGQEKKFHEQSINVSNLYFQNVYLWIGILVLIFLTPPDFL